MTEDIIPYVPVREFKPDAKGRKVDVRAGWSRKLKKRDGYARSIAVYPTKGKRAFVLEFHTGPDRHHLLVHRDSMEALVELFGKVEGRSRSRKVLYRIIATALDDAKGQSGTGWQVTTEEAGR